MIRKAVAVIVTHPATGGAYRGDDEDGRAATMMILRTMVDLLWRLAFGFGGPALLGSALTAIAAVLPLWRDCAVLWAAPISLGRPSVLRVRGTIRLAGR